MNCSYRIIKSEDSEGTVWFGLHEVYFRPTGEVDGFTPPILVGNSAEIIMDEVQKIFQDVLNQSDLFADPAVTFQSNPQANPGIEMREILIENEDSEKILCKNFAKGRNGETTYRIIVHEKYPKEPWFCLRQVFRILPNEIVEYNDEPILTTISKEDLMDEINRMMRDLIENSDVLISTQAVQSD